MKSGGFDESDPEETNRDDCVPDPDTNNDPFIDANGSDYIPGNEDDDLRLKASSTAIDSGNNSALPQDSLDLDDDGDRSEAIPLDLAGGSRVQNGTVDMGAYEFSA